MTQEPPSAALLASLNEALDLLADHRAGPYDLDGDVEPLASLVAHCSALVENAPDEAPIRTIHHFACTGGTLISKLIASMPNTVVLSEIDPLSKLMVGDARNPFFAPTDLIYGARVALRPIDDQVAIRMFQASLSVLQGHMCETGQHLVLRDHSHSHFCTDTDADSRPTLRSMVQGVGPVRSVVTVRHPLDSFLSLDRNGWRHFQPFTLGEYAKRYRRFLDRHSGVTIIRYEDLVADPDHHLEHICTELDLPFRPGSEAMLPIVAMSGDSGRKSAKIGPRGRQALSAELTAQIEENPCYAQLCTDLGYPDFT